MIKLRLNVGMTGKDLIEILGNPPPGKYVLFDVVYDNIRPERWMAWRSMGRGKYHGKMYVHLVPIYDSFIFKNWIEGCMMVGLEEDQIFSSFGKDCYRVECRYSGGVRRDIVKVLKDAGLMAYAHEIENLLCVKVLGVKR